MLSQIIALGSPRWLLTIAVLLLSAWWSASVVFAGFPGDNKAPTSRAQGKSHGIALPKAQMVVADEKLARTSPSRPDRVLHDQYDSPSYMSLSSQSFEPRHKAYDAHAADDFIVPAGESWVVDELDVAGVYSPGGGPAESVNITIYATSDSLPGAAVFSQTNIVPSAGLDTGDYTIPLYPAIRLPSGTYWISVQANQSATQGGQWYWRGRKSSFNHNAAWRNPGGAFGRAECRAEWGNRAYICFVSNDVYDQVFRLSGHRNNAVPGEGIAPVVLPNQATSLPTRPAREAVDILPPPVGTVPPSPVATSTPAPSCGFYWRISSSPNYSQSGNILYEVAAISANDIWAVGHIFINNSQEALILHWNGRQWSRVANPNIGQSSVLRGVAATSATDVWAVGRSQGNGVLMLHWDGVEWSVAPVLNGPISGHLMDVAAISEDDAWAVGYDSGNRAMSFHWDGTAWRQVSTPVLESSLLDGVSATSSNDVWAVGSVSSGFGRSTLALHWDGTAWSVINTPITPDDSAFRAVWATSPNDVWAVGYHFINIFDHVTLIEHWDGISWTIVPSPAGEINSDLTGIVGISSNDVWAVGVAQYFGQSYLMSRPLTLHWDGLTWSEVPSPNPSESSLLHGVTAVSRTDIWAAGYYWNYTQSVPARTLIERYNNPCSIRATGTPTSTAANTPSSTPTNTPTNTSTSTPTRTSTSTPTSTHTNTATSTYTYTPTGTPTSTATNTPGSTHTATPTVCSMSFNDVPSGSTFHNPVMCLACRGIISGYADGTFKPDNLVTRGQLAKIVSNAANFTEPSGPQIFQDVAPDHTFYEWINRLTNRSYMSGYNCGGPGEPCVNNRPYFRPFNNATRAQTSKIVSNAARYNDPPTGQTFEDVPPTHPFYTEIQRLASRNIMGGYNCGGPGEPCMPPENKPYFRPYNDVTRGQSAKIVANTFYPDCQSR